MSKFQFNYSSIYKNDTLYDYENRLIKAKKIIAVLEDYLPELSKLSVLDIGCSTGLITNFLSNYFSTTMGVDIDDKAIEYAKENAQNGSEFLLNKKLHYDIPSNSFDVISCIQVYEHVPDYNILMDEIHRMLKPGGVCYFSAGNRITLIEAHHKLPFLSVIPKKLAHYYLRIFTEHNYYFENHLTYWGLKDLVKKFQIIDFTKLIIKDPIRYHATDMIKPNSISHTFFNYFANVLYPFIPNYIWLLKK